MGLLSLMNGNKVSPPVGSMETMWETWSSTPTHRYCPSHFLLSWYQIRPSRESGLLPKSSSNKAPPPNSVRDAMWGVMRQPSTPSQTAISGCTIEPRPPPLPSSNKATLYHQCQWKSSEEPGLLTLRDTTS